MSAVVTGRQPRASIAGVLVAMLCAACGGGGGEAFVDVGEGAAGAKSDRGEAIAEFVRTCERVEVDGDLVVEREKDFTARFRLGEPYTKTVMLFGGEPVNDDNVLSTAYIFALDKQDALMLAQKYPDFAYCGSVGGQEAARYIAAYDLLSANCGVHDRIVTALRDYNRNVAAGGDRTSLRFEGAPLQLESVTANATGQDVTDQAHDQDFHLVTSVEQLTGQSVVEFGTTD